MHLFDHVPAAAEVDDGLESLSLLCCFPASAVSTQLKVRKHPKKAKKKKQNGKKGNNEDIE